MRYNEKGIDVVIPVYNDNQYLEETLVSISNQRLPENWGLHVYVVDDGSEEPVAVNVDNDNDGNISIVRLKKNSGCSVARNKGAWVGNGGVILFLDADCSLAKEDVLVLLLEEYLKGYDVCFGQIYASQGDFWAKYQNDVAKERAANFLAGEKSSMTTSIFMVNRQVFKSAGGFDEEYHFGFEDRDLFITLIDSGAKVSLVESAIVNHNDQLSLISVCKKLYNSGATSSSRFIDKHSDEYMEMAYAKADVRVSKGGLQLLVLLTKPIVWPLVSVLDWLLKKEVLPYWLARRAVKYMSGLVYLHGTSNR